MLDFVTLDDIKGDFWEQNPEIELHQPFANFKKNKRSSDIMKAIYLVYDPKSISKRGNISEEQSKKDIAENLLGDPNFDWEPYVDIIRAYKEKCKTKLQVELEKWLYDIQERLQYGNELSWSDEAESKRKDDILLSHKKYMDAYIEVERKVKDEMASRRMKNGYHKSMLEMMGTSSSK